MENYSTASGELLALCVSSAQIGPQQTASRGPKEEARERREREESSTGSCLERICIRTGPRMRATPGHVWLTPDRHDIQRCCHGLWTATCVDRTLVTWISQRKTETSGSRRNATSIRIDGEIREGTRMLGWQAQIKPPYHYRKKRGFISQVKKRGALSSFLSVDTREPVLPAHVSDKSVLTGPSLSASFVLD